MRKNLLAFALIVALMFFSLAATAQQSDGLPKTSARIMSSILIDGQSLNYLQVLSDKIGPRLTGSAAHQRAAQWAAEQFRAFGIKNVRLEPFTIPNGWERGAAYARITAPFDRLLHAGSIGWTPGLPPNGVTSEVVLINDLSGEKLQAQADKIKGRVVMLDVEAFSQGQNNPSFGLVTSYQVLKDIGAIALLWPDREPNNILNAHSGHAFQRAQAGILPSLKIGMEDGKLIKRLLNNGAVSVELRCDNRLSGPVQVNNVIAEIPGREKPDEWIVVGAHLDSWDYGTGAQDNGTGCAMVLEAARAIAALGQPPRRSIRFALWGGEEQGLLGSFAYLNDHASELKKCVAVLNTDNGAGHPRGWKVQGREDLRKAMGPISQTLLSSLSGEGLSLALTFDTDHGPFLLHGIPALDLWVDMTHYGEIHHKSSDTVDKVQPHNLMAGSAIVAITAYAVAEQPEVIAPHLDQAAVVEQFKKAQLDEILKRAGLLK
ncbi:MAG: M20/M25/M40 family metallo-hydrolase [Acidobacteriota bacterium]